VSHYPLEVVPRKNFLARYPLLEKIGDERTLRGIFATVSLGSLQIVVL